MIKIENKKTAIVGGVVGLVILLTIFCCKGTNEEAPAVEAAPAGSKASFISIRSLMHHLQHLNLRFAHQSMELQTMLSFAKNQARAINFELSK